MNSFIFRLGTSNSKKVTSAKTNSVDDFCKMIASVFAIRDQIIGVTDDNGKFYDMDFVNANPKLFRNHVLNLVLAKENDENMSFDVASDNLEFYPPKKSDQVSMPINQKQELFHSPNGLLGYVQDLKFFEQLLLEDDKPAIIFCTMKSNLDLIKISYNFYIKHVEKQEYGRVIVYFNRKKIGDIYIVSWENIDNVIEGLLKNYMYHEQNLDDQRRMSKKFQNEPNKQSQRAIISRKMKRNKNYREVELEQQSEDQIELRQQSVNQVEIQEIKNTFLENLIKLKEEQTISELEFYKLKSKLLQNPQEFMRKYQMGTRQGFRRHKSIDELRDEIVRSKQEKSRYQTMINEFREVRAPSRQGNFGSRGHKNEIPIIVRKYNNKIEKISTSYPLTLQQEQAINLIMELQLKGLISELDSREYKGQILQQNQGIFELFDLYFEETIDQIELARRLVNKKKLERKTLEEKKKSEEIVRCIIKYAKRNSFELLRNLALQGNHYVLKCFQKYEYDKNQQNLALSLQKVANYYRTKNSLDTRLHIADNRLHIVDL